MVEQKRIVVTGATGLIGGALCRKLLRRGYGVIVFSRYPEKARAQLPGALDYVAWEPQATGPWASYLDGVDGVVHMAGGSLFTFGKRQTKASVQAETQARVRGIGGLVHAMAQAQEKPAVFVSASSVGTYGFQGLSDAEFTEESPAGTDFWGRDSLAWEQAAQAAQEQGVRSVVLRTGYVLDATPSGGLAGQVRQFQSGFGGPVLPGSQWTPWIHLADEVNLALLALEDERVQGPLNCTAPGGLRNRDFARELGKAVGKPARVPIPGLFLRLGIGLSADTIIYGRHVVPKKAQDLGFSFQFPHLSQALDDLVVKQLLPSQGKK